MEREIDPINFLFMFNSNFKLESTSDEDIYKISDLSNSRIILAYQGWKVGSFNYNERQRKAFKLPMGKFISSIDTYNLNNPENKYTPSLVLKTTTNENPFLMTVKRFSLTYDSDLNQHLSLLVTPNYKDANSNEFYSIDNLLDTQLKGNFMFNGFSYKTLNHCNYLDSNKVFHSYDRKRKINPFEQGSLARDLRNSLPIRCVNFLYKNDFTLEKMDNGNLLLKHVVVENTPHLFTFQGWDEYTKIANNQNSRIIDTISLNDFCDYIKITRNQIISDKVVLGQGSEKRALDRFSFEPTCVFNIDGDLDHDGFPVNYIGVIKNFTYIDTPLGSNDPLTSSLINVEHSFNIEISLNQMDTAYGTSIKDEYYGQTKNIFLNIDTADQGNSGSTTEDGKTYTAQEVLNAIAAGFRSFTNTIDSGGTSISQQIADKITVKKSKTCNGGGKKDDDKPSDAETFFIGLGSFLGMMVLMGAVGKLISGVRTANRINQEEGSGAAVDYMKTIGSGVVDVATTALHGMGFDPSIKYEKAIRSHDPELAAQLEEAKYSIGQLRKGEADFLKTVDGYSDFAQMRGQCELAGIKARKQFRKTNPKPKEPNPDEPDPVKFREDRDAYLKYKDDEQKAFDDGFKAKINSDDGFKIVTKGSGRFNVKKETTTKSGTEIMDKFMKNTKIRCKSKADNLEASKEAFPFSNQKVPPELANDATKINEIERDRLTKTAESLTDPDEYKRTGEDAFGPDASEMYDEFSKTPIGENEGYVFHAEI
jgi:hypothetical protein